MAADVVGAVAVVVLDLTVVVAGTAAVLVAALVLVEDVLPGEVMLISFTVAARLKRPLPKYKYISSPRTWKTEWHLEVDWPWVTHWSVLLALAEHFKASHF